MYMSAPCMSLVPGEARKGHWVPGPGVKDGCEPPCGSRKPNPGSLQEQLEPLTADLSLQYLYFVFLKIRSYLYVCICEHVCIRICAQECRAHREASRDLEVEFQVAVSHQKWVPPARAARALNTVPSLQPPENQFG